jgi:hypothetical protein
MIGEQQSIILCEGYDDRSFWAGWLMALGCREAKGRDPWGRPVNQGKYAYRTPTGAFVLVHPCDGRERLAEHARLYLSGHPTHPLAQLLINHDSDADAPEWGDVTSELRKLGGAPVEVGTSSISDGVPATAIVWGCNDGVPTAGVPIKQTLERLVAASIVAAYPDRGPAVQSWLDGPPSTLGSPSKAHAYSLLAKWYGDHGCDDFFRAIWRDELVRRQLENRLRERGAWQAVETALGK